MWNGMNEKDTLWKGFTSDREVKQGNGLALCLPVIDYDAK